MSTPVAASELQSTLRDLSLDEKQHSAIKDVRRPTVKLPMGKEKAASAAAAPVAESWEDELGSDSDLESDELGTASKDISNNGNNSNGTGSPSAFYGEGPLDPPPTPISPTTSQPWTSSGGYGNPARRSPVPAIRRPEKQTAVAGRLIAGALGIRAPKRTEEQRAYDRTVKEQEIKRRNREREEAAKAQEDEERAKAAVWDA